MELVDLRWVRPDWQRDALCVEYPDVEFFPERGQPAGPAKAICARCLVREECLADSLAEGQLHGIWGGLSAHDRRKLRWPPRD